MNGEYKTFFQTALGMNDEPHPYQTKLATEPWPELLDIPTGLGKTAAVVLAWLYKRRNGEPGTPRRLVYCLPMRVLVEQTHDNIIDWLKRLNCFADTAEEKGISVHRLMGGEADTRAWVRYPEKDMILIGTQDMLLSRALMRGYGMSRYRWPIDFALLHNDSLWVFDEIQLMGAGLPTSTQLEAFRRRVDMPGSAKSLWVSATLNRQWFNSIDLRPHLGGLRSLTLDEQEKQGSAVRKCREAVKKIRPAKAMLDAETNKGDAKAYLDALTENILEAHSGDAPTLVILNNVQRCQKLYEELAKRFKDQVNAPELLLVHSRFRQAERISINKRVLRVTPNDNIIVIATQAIEAGVDISSRVMFSELAPWSSMVQRFGRCNRAGEYAEARVYWLDIASGEKLSPPYTDEELDATRNILGKLESVAVADLPPPKNALPLYQVIRRKDFLELFNTDADLSGFDIDISPWIRDGGTPPVRVFWRDFGDHPGDQNAPLRDELCPVSIGRFKKHLTKEKDRAFAWDTLAQRWEAVAGDRVRPGMTILLRCSDGGYSPQLGFKAGYKNKKEPLCALAVSKSPPDGIADDSFSQLDKFVGLPEHLSDVAKEAGQLCEAVDEQQDKAAVVRAGRWHDVGKAHPAFQSMLLLNAFSKPDRACRRQWAKNDYTRHPRKSRKKALYAVCKDDPNLRICEERRHEKEVQYIACDGSERRIIKRHYFRHELASLLVWLEHGDKDADHDLTAYLIAAHHGKVRMGLRALPDEQGPGDTRCFARGVWEGDRLPAFYFDGKQLPETTLRLDIMELGDGAMGPSWSTRTQLLLQYHGPFRLAWLETLVRLADWRASARYREEGQT